jgi:hypothetical protein
LARLLGRDDADWLERYAEKIQQAIDDAFWLEEEGYYAMRLKPDGSVDKTPFSFGLLRPLWVVKIKPNDDNDRMYDRAVRSALEAYTKLYHSNGFLRLIPTHDQTVTMGIGYLLNAMKKIGHPEIDRVLHDVLKWADPSGTFGEYLDEREDGPWQCYEHMAHRNRMWESGINADAVFQTLAGFQPSAYESRVSFAPYLPKNWKYFDARRLRVGAAYLDLLHHREGGQSTITVEHHGGTALTVDVHLRAERKATVTLNGVQAATTWRANRFGIYTTTLPCELTESQSMEVVVSA